MNDEYSYDVEYIKRFNIDYENLITGSNIIERIYIKKVNNESIDNPTIILLVDLLDRFHTWKQNQLTGIIDSIGRIKEEIRPSIDKMDKLKSWEGIGIVNRYMGKCKEGNFNIDRDDFREILEIFLKKVNDINEEIKKLNVGNISMQLNSAAITSERYHKKSEYLFDECAKDLRLDLKNAIDEIKALQLKRNASLFHYFDSLYDSDYLRYQDAIKLS
ncbi:hypothetical protein [Xenorhabdus nematophila]|nr:hypothetical protein [Xenorhabdus nematophila]CEE93846.1 hypothetical protein XNA1_4380017 [Xenorhabdus nematophila str. Anatoliense]CEE95954.1 hypothetical protein XNA1_890017 [Xenorhabdus nematophila str. Anatoliense]CEK23013.1 hypothetical protein XNC2_2019 [Xenorhabdus nematophila AN6/1]